MVKLQKQVAYKYRGHNIYKFRVNLPSNIIEGMGWDEGTELAFSIHGDVVEMRQEGR